jgi:hypothetical protein
LLDLLNRWISIASTQNKNQNCKILYESKGNEIDKLILRTRMETEFKPQNSKEDHQHLNDNATAKIKKCCTYALEICYYYKI